MHAQVGTSVFIIITFLPELADGHEDCFVEFEERRLGGVLYHLELGPR